MRLKQYQENVNITNCDKEPIQIIPFTQDYGFLLVCDPNTLQIIQISENVERFLGLKKDAILNCDLAQILPKDSLQQFQNRKEKPTNFSAEKVSIGNTSWSMLPTLHDEHLLIDFEPWEEIAEPLLLQKELSQLINFLDDAQSITEMAGQTVKMVRESFGYDRVMLYEFDAEWNGEVIAEDKQKEMKSWLGLRYPASDIPKPAREIFLQQGVRMIADVKYASSPLLPEVSPLTQKPLNIAKSELRGVSPIHIQYLKNMGVGASLTAAIIVDGDLWGLLACHHNKAKRINYYQRQTCKFLTQVFSNKLSLKNTKTYLNKLEKSDNFRKELVTQMQETKSLSEALTAFKTKFTNLVSCSGGALILDDTIKLLGKTPTEKEVIRLKEDFLKNQSESVYFQRNLGAFFPSAKAYSQTASGILSLRLDQSNKNFVLWFRTEEAQEVSWGGKPKIINDPKDDLASLSPRTSFEKWTTKQSGISKAWKSYDIKAAENLLEDISAFRLTQQKDKVARLNNQLSLANKELETFSYTVSHDLRAPLRGIKSYLKILQEDLADGKTDTLPQIVETITTATAEMDTLIENLLNYAKNAAGNIRPTKIAVNPLIENILKKNNVVKNYPQTKIEIVHNLPNIYGDAQMIEQLFTNLLENALKYSAEKQEAHIKIGFEKQQQNTVFYVKDNGIGFKEENAKKLFDPFIRLAPKNIEGSGIGLATVKKVIEKHQGKIWAESKPGKGSVFYFILAT